MSIEYRLHVEAHLIPGRRQRGTGEPAVTLRLHDANTPDPLRGEINVPVCVDVDRAQARELARRLNRLACWAERIDEDEEAAR